MEEVGYVLGYELGDDGRSCVMDLLIHSDRESKELTYKETGKITDVGDLQIVNDEYFHKGGLVKPEYNGEEITVYTTNIVGYGEYHTAKIPDRKRNSIYRVNYVEKGTEDEYLYMRVELELGNFDNGLDSVEVGLKIMEVKSLYDFGDVNVSDNFVDNILPELGIDIVAESIYLQTVVDRTTLKIVK